MVETRKATGNSVPRKADPLFDAAPTPKKRVNKPKTTSAGAAKRGRPSSKVTKTVTDAKNKTKAAATKVKKDALKSEKKVEKKASETKANTGKPRAKKAEGKKDKVASGRVEKKPAAKKAKTENKREPGILDKIEGAAEKVVGAIQGKPGKKVCLFRHAKRKIFRKGRTFLCFDGGSISVRWRIITVSIHPFVDYERMLTNVYTGCRYSKDARYRRQGSQAGLKGYLNPRLPNLSILPSEP